MFYSQFILAKKGPLGTIWIAAHLERKLRKNQVADTDIGVSVDSILFPDAPIALRLSSHLLLGVVRIYSRKVNYLFHDCSEALLKIKQAFRSTAVDLPPEESTAPYHSITLPETFHLDDFELPDSAFIHGNSVDHHVSTRELITLQDTTDGLAYSTSLFGLDERFCDGDTSQIGLDLDEDLFLAKMSSSQHVSSPFGAEDVLQHGQPSTSLNDMDILHDQYMYNDDDANATTPKDISEFISTNCDKHFDSELGDAKVNNDTSCQHGYNIQTPDLNEVFLRHDQIEGPSATFNVVNPAFSADDVPSPQLIECSQVMSMEEAIPANVQETSVPSHHANNLPPNFVNNIGTEIPGIRHPEPEFDCPDATNNSAVDSVAMVPQSMDIAPMPSSSTLLEPVSFEPQHPCGVVDAGDDASFECGKRSADNFHHELASDKADGLSNSDQLHDGGEVMHSEEGPLNDSVSFNFSLEANNSKMPVEMSLPDAETCIPSRINIASGTSEINNTSLEGSNLSDQALVQDPNTCHTSNRIEPGSEFHFQSCSSQLNEPNMVSLEDGTLLENGPAFACKEMDCTPETPATEVVMQDAFAPVDVTGQISHLADAAEPIAEVHQTSESVVTESMTGFKKPGELSSGNNIKNNQSDHLNCSSSSEFPEPEKMLLAPTSNVDQPNDLGQLTSEKGVTDSDESVDKIKSLSGKKRHLTESISALQNDSSAKLSGRPRLRRNTEYIPDDDDLLASILVGRTPNFKVQPTPPPHTVISLKRQRLNPRGSTPKRKVLLDDAMVLHADAIRQQLINTEDIRRIRKKAPCTRSEIWMLQSSSEELEIFEESIFTGISAELHGLHTRTYPKGRNRDFQYGRGLSRMAPAKGAEFSRNSKIVGETCVGDVDGQVVVLSDNVDNENQCPSRSALVKETDSTDAEKCDAQDQVASETDLHQPEPSSNNAFMTSDIDADNRCARDMHVVSSPNADYVNELPNVCRSEAIDTFQDDKLDESHAKNDDGCMHGLQPWPHESTLSSSEQKEMNDEIILITKDVPAKGLTSIDDAAGDRICNDIPIAIVNDDTRVLADDATISASGNEKTVDAVNTNCNQEHLADLGQINTEETLISTDNRTHEIGVLLQSESSAVSGRENHFIPDMPMEVVDPNLHDVFRHSESCFEVGGDNIASRDQMFHNEEHPICKTDCQDKVQDSCARQPNVETENIPSTVGENSGLHEFNPEGYVEGAPLDLAAAKESSDFCSAINGNDTEFLIADDEDYCEADDEQQNPEEAQSLENSGWSSRTRGVAKYLKTLFDDEYGRGRKVVAMDNLLVGKTRKEASRMFFETLVLKTKDYIHVEQENPFHCINIKPRTKLLKSEF